MANIRVQSKVTAVEIDFGPGHPSLIFERDSEGGVLIGRVTTEGGQSTVGSITDEQFDELRHKLSKL